MGNLHAHFAGSCSMRNPASYVGTKDKFQFISELTANILHRGKPFYEHLINVFMYLKVHLHCSDEVCDAGLFHSIYGTEFYKFHKLQRSGSGGEVLEASTRDVIKGIIGGYAEELVYIFCTARPRFEVIVNNTLGLSNQQVIDLCHIEIANLEDQNENGFCNKKLEILRSTVLRLRKQTEKTDEDEDTKVLETQEPFSTSI